MTLSWGLEENELCDVLILLPSCCRIGVHGKGRARIAVCHWVLQCYLKNLVKVRIIRLLSTGDKISFWQLTNHSFVFISVFRVSFPCNYSSLRAVPHVTLPIKENGGMSLYWVYCRCPRGPFSKFPKVLLVKPSAACSVSPHTRADLGDFSPFEARTLTFIEMTLDLNRS